MQFIQIVLDFVFLGVVGVCYAVGMALWWTTLEVLIFAQGYCVWLNKHGLLKVALIIGTGTSLLYYLVTGAHSMLWGMP